MGEMKRLKEAVETLKYYCRNHVDCGDCIFHDDKNTGSWFVCLLRGKRPHNWDTDKLKDLPKLTDDEKTILNNLGDRFTTIYKDGNMVYIQNEHNGISYTFGVFFPNLFKEIEGGEKYTISGLLKND